MSKLRPKRTARKAAARGDNYLSTESGELNDVHFYTVGTVLYILMYVIVIILCKHFV